MKGYTCCKFHYTIIKQLYLIPRKRVLLEKLPVSQVVSNSCNLCNTQIQYRGSCWWSWRYTCV